MEPQNIQYLKGDATSPIGKGPRIIAHICNDIGGWGKGFVMALSKKWKAPEQEYRAWHAEGKDFALGAIQMIEVAPEIWVANMIAQHKVRSQNGVPPIRYDALEKALGQLALFALEHKAEVHGPRMGAGLAGGDWEKIEALLLKNLCQTGIRVFIYDFVP